MALHSELRGVALDQMNKMNEVLISKASTSLGLNYPNELVLRQLLPTDIGSTTTQNWTWNIAATGYQNLIAAQIINDTRFVGIYGLAYSPLETRSTGLAEQVFSGVRITRASKTARIWNFQEIPGEGSNIDPTKRAYVDDPLTVDQNISLTIEGYVLNAGTAVLAFIGSAVEPIGLTIAT